MDILRLAHHLFVLIFLVFLFNTAATQSSNFENSNEPFRICKYERFAEVQRECSSFLSSTSKLKLEKEKVYYETATELSFVNGDWVQEAGGAPLMPFDDSDMPENFSSPGSLLKLVSFWLMGIDFSRQLENAIYICGYLSIAITRDRTLSNRPETWSPLFFKRPGTSEMRIPFEGLYMESEENEGERLMCLLGTSIPPFSEGSSDPINWSMPYRSGCNQQSSLSLDDRIMLVLRYPKRYTLTNRAIYGEMRSLNENSNPNYFDRVYMSSQLGYNSKYLFGSEMVSSKAPDLYPDQHELVDNGVKFKGLQFCKAFLKFEGEKFDIVENSRCDGKGENCNNLHPFVLGNGVKAVNGIPPKFRLMMNNLHCVPEDDLNEPETAKVSASFRAFFSPENWLTAGGRTGLSGMTISAEGTWNSSSGQFCMVGCVGLTKTGSDGCNSRVCLHFPATFSITQRSIISGTISSLQKRDSYSPLLFRKVLYSLDLWNSYYVYSNSYLSYKYSKIESASILLKRNEFTLGTIMKKSFLTYPSVEDTNNITSVSHLSNELSFGAYALPVPEPLPNSRPPKTYVWLEVLSLGSLFGRYWPDWSDSYQTADIKLLNNSDSTKQNQFLNVSAYLTLTGESYGDISLLFLEGLYNPLDGKIFFVGCRDAPVFHESIINNPSLENRMDCLIEVKVEYSSRTIRWLINPTAKVSISSQRNDEDPLYFRPIILKTELIPYLDNSEDIMIRRNFEAVLRILVLSASTACMLSQVLYIQKKANVIPFISLTMFGVQALCFCLPLFTGIAILFKWKEFEGHMNHPYPRKTMWFQVLDCIVKSLLLVAFVLSLRLFQKIRKSRLRLLAKKPMNVNQNPSDRPVFLSSWATHMVGFLTLLIIDNKKSENGARTRNYYYKPPEWVTDLGEYMGLVQDLFLLPQIIGNIIWKKTQVKPLTEAYYIGFTALRLLIRAYDYVRDPVLGFYDHEEDIKLCSELFSKSEEIVIMAILVVLAITVGLQQRWNFNRGTKVSTSVDLDSTSQELLSS